MHTRLGENTKRNFPSRRNIIHQTEGVGPTFLVNLFTSLSFEGIPSTPSASGRPGVRHSSEPRKPRFGLPLSGSSDEDPYSLTPSGSSGSSGKGHRSGSGGENGSGQRSSDMSSGQENGGGGHRFHSREREYYGPQNWAKVSMQLPIHVHRPPQKIMNYRVEKKLPF